MVPKVLSQLRYPPPPPRGAPVADQELTFTSNLLAQRGPDEAAGRPPPGVGLLLMSYTPQKYPDHSGPKMTPVFPFRIQKHAAFAKK